MASRDSFTIIVSARGWERRCDELADVLAAQFGGPSLRFELGLRKGEIEAMTVLSRSEAEELIHALSLLDVSARVVVDSPAGKAETERPRTQMAGWAHAAPDAIASRRPSRQSGPQGTLLGVGGHAKHPPLPDFPPTAGGESEDSTRSAARGDVSGPQTTEETSEDGAPPHESTIHPASGRTVVRSGGWAAVLGSALHDRPVAGTSEPAVSFRGEAIEAEIGASEDWGAARTVMLDDHVGTPPGSASASSGPPLPSAESDESEPGNRGDDAGIPWPAAPPVSDARSGSAPPKPGGRSAPAHPPSRLAFPEPDALERAAAANGGRAKGASPFLRKDAAPQAEYNPLAAALWSVLAPGAGQAYNRELSRGVTFALSGIFVVPWVVSIMDASRRARALNERRGKRLPPDSNGGILIAAGFWFGAIVVILAFRFLLISLESGGPEVELPPLTEYQTVDSGIDSDLTQPSDDGSATPAEDVEDASDPRSELARIELLEEVLLLGRLSCDAGRFEACRAYAEEALELDETNREAQTLHVEAITALATGDVPEPDAGKESEETP